MALLSPQSPETRQKHRVLSACAGLSAAFLIFAAPVFANKRGPDVVVIAEENKMVYEFRQNGELRMIRVVPNVGKPYYLVPKDPTKGNGDLARTDALIPSWVLWEFD